MKHSCIHIYCGNGKGKSTAAVGLSVRAKGAGLTCACFFFLKNGSSNEIPMLKSLGIHTQTAPHSDKFIWNMDEAEKQQFFAAQHDLFLQATQYPCDVLILDEVLDACALGIVSKEELQAFLQQSTAEIVLTGRDGSDFAELADYYTVMTAQKHPYDNGLPARKGIEF